MRAFLEAPWHIYRNDPNWIPHLEKDIEAVFDKTQNAFFENGEASRWILHNDRHELIGRVAAFVNHQPEFNPDQPTGGVGFFECINDKEAAFLLFDTCLKWLQKRGMEAMDAPINFGQRNKFWGLLVEGFTPPVYGMNYNPPYYQDLFEDYGFKVYFKQYSYSRKIDDPLPIKVQHKANRLLDNPDYQFRPIDKKQLPKYAEHLRQVYNSAWSDHEGFSEMTKQEAQAMMRSMKPILEEELIIMGYYKGEPIGFFLMLPEINQLFKHVNGKMNLWGKLKFMYYRWRGECRKIFGMAFGVAKDFQFKGVEAALIQSAADLIHSTGRYDEIELTWIADFNPIMLKVVEALGVEHVKTYHTYRKMFNEDKQVQRATNIIKA